MVLGALLGWELLRTKTDQAGAPADADDIYLVQLLHGAECVILVDERKGVAVDPGEALYYDFPGRLKESDRYRFLWSESGNSTRALPGVIATPAAVASAWKIAPGEVWVVRA